MKSCLIVDDSSVVRKVARRILEDIDYVVDEAEDGQEAFDKCRQEMPDAIHHPGWDNIVLAPNTLATRVQNYNFTW